MAGGVQPAARPARCVFFRVSQCVRVRFARSVPRHSVSISRSSVVDYTAPSGLSRRVRSQPAALQRKALNQRSRATSGYPAAALSHNHSGDDRERRECVRVKRPEEAAEPKDGGGGLSRTNCDRRHLHSGHAYVQFFLLCNVQFVTCAVQRQARD